MRVARTALVAILLVAGAAGLSSHAGEDLCLEPRVAQHETVSWTDDFAWWPPGASCVFSLPDGGTATYESGSAPWFLVVLACELLIAAWALRRWPDARLTFATMLAFAALGVGWLVSGFAFAFAVGWALGTPLAWAAGGWAGAVVAATALLLAAFLYLFGLGAAAFLIPLALVALSAAAGSRRSSRSTAMRA